MIIPFETESQIMDDEAKEAMRQAEIKADADLKDAQDKWNALLGLYNFCISFLFRLNWMFILLHSFQHSTNDEKVIDEKWETFRDHIYLTQDDYFSSVSVPPFPYN